MSASGCERAATCSSAHDHLPVIGSHTVIGSLLTWRPLPGRIAGGADVGTTPKAQPTGGPGAGQWQLSKGGVLIGQRDVLANLICVPRRRLARRAAGGPAKAEPGADAGPAAPRAAPP